MSGDFHENLVTVLILAGLALLLAAWVWTFVLTITGKNYGWTIACLLLTPLLAILYAVRYPTRCKIPLIMFLGGGVMVATSFMPWPPSAIFEAAMSAEEAISKGDAAYDQKDYASALHFYQLAADKGNAQGQRHLGSLYKDGKGVAQNDTQAVAWYAKSAAQGDAGAQGNLGAMYAQGRGGLAKDDGEAARLFKLSADQGDTYAQTWLGLFYENGRGGLAKSDVDAARLFKLAADKGNAFAQRELGMMYESGSGGLAKDDQEAARLFKLSADQGDPLGQAWLAFFSERGRGGLAQNDQEAARLYKLAADQGNAFSQNALGLMYENGHGVAKDYQQAIDWYTKADKNGFDEAKTNLLRMRAYTPGMLNVLFTDLKAQDFSNGHASSCSFLATVYNNTKYHLNKASFKIGELEFNVGEMSANTFGPLKDGNAVPYLDVSDGSADCADAIFYLFKNVDKAEIYDCSMTGLPEGDCQQLFHAYTNISADAVKKMQDIEDNATKTQLAPLKAALSEVGVNETNLNPNDQAKLTRLLDAVVRLDSVSWSFNRYRSGSVYNIGIINRAADGSRVTIQGSFWYQDNKSGWVKLTLFKNRLPCIEFWDFEGTCRLIHLPDSAAQR